MLDTTDPRQAVAEHAGREIFGKLTSYLASRFDSYADAEDALSAALVTALESWPDSGIPDNPSAWLLTVARRRLADNVRMGARAALAQTHLQMIQEELEELAVSTTDLPDRRLELMFSCTHPLIDRAVQVPLMLQLILGFDAEAIGSAFLISGNTMGQRLARAKNKMRESGVAFEIPDANTRRERLGAILDAVYVCYHAGWMTLSESGNDKRSEGLWLASILLKALPDEPEVLGLNALLLHLDARKNADNHTPYVPLEHRDTRGWDKKKIIAADRLLKKSAEMGAPGRFQIEAAIQSVHSDRYRTGDTDWQAILDFYGVLLNLAPSTGARIGQAAARCLSGDSHAAIKSLEAINRKLVRDHQPFWAVYACAKEHVGDLVMAVEAYAIASGLSIVPAEKSYLLNNMIRLQKNLPEM